MFLFSSGWTIKCYKCSPDFQSLSSDDKKDCSNPTETKDCSSVKLGNLATDSCLTVSLTLSHPSVSRDVSAYFQDYGVKSLCTVGTNSLCANLRANINGTGTQLKVCKGECCEGDLCNDPAEAPTNTGPTTSCALLAILGLIAVAFKNMF